MFSTRPVSWASLQTLRSHLNGRLVRFRRNDNAANSSLLRQVQNDVDFFEADLRYIFMIIPTVTDIPDDEYDELNQLSHNLLTALDGMVNQDFIKAFKAPKTGGPRTGAHDIIIGNPYPRLCSIITLLETSSSHFHLITGQDSLFVLIEGQTRVVAMDALAHMKEVLERLANGAREHKYPRLSQKPPTDLSAEKPSGAQDGVPRKHASLVVNTLFRDIRQRSCGKQHEIKLKVPGDWQTGPQKTVLDMFLSCCLDQEAWHRTRFGNFQAGISERQNDGICAAIQRAKIQGRAIYLSIDRQEIFDISDKISAMPSVSTELTSETLEELLNQKALTPITPSDYEAKTAVTKLSYREKAILALSLARCLLEFIDDDMELASHSWKPESIYFLKSAGTQQDRAPYISLKPSLRGCQLPESLGAIGLGNPVLLSFAKLLLEIDIGERIKKEIDYESNANLSTWVWMCGFVDEVEQTGGGNFLQAVKGCLYLHVYKAHYQSDDVDVGYITRKVIYEQIVRQLERVIHTQSLKRKRQGSVSEPPLSKKPSIDTSALEMGMQLTEVSPNKKIPWIRPASRADFEVAVVCALPLEFDAICTVVDEFWDEDFGKVDGDQNMYTNARIGKLNIVILLLPNMGKVSAASTCASLRSSYPGISLVLVTGVCGAVPFLGGGEEILLGDVIISRHIIQYDLGRQYPDEFKTRDTMNDRLSRAPKNVRNLLALVDTNRGRERLEQLTSTYLEDIQTKSTQKLRGPKYRYPGASQDRLFQPDYRHQRRVPSHATTLSETHKTSVCASIESHKASCDELGCDSEQLVLRKRIKKKLQREEAGYIKESQAPLIFVGTIGSGDTVMRSGEERDKIASTHGLLAFEMEGAGVWDEMPCIVIKGVCDYADSHKSKNWQDFAAATAASATKALMSWYIHRDKTSRA